MSDQAVVRNSASDVAQMRKDWVESYHFNAEVELPGLLDDYDALLSLNAELLEALEEAAGDLFLQIEPKHGAKAASQYPSFLKARAALAKARSQS